MKHNDERIVGRNLWLKNRRLFLFLCMKGEEKIMYKNGKLVDALNVEYPYETKIYDKKASME